MAKRYLLIDGYNLLYAAGLAPGSNAHQQLERARRQLLIFLGKHLTQPEREFATVAFDAQNAPVDLNAEPDAKYERIRVLFARVGGDADSLIEEIIAEHSAPKQIQVVSGDHRLQKAARRRRGTFITSDQFLGRLHHRGPIVDDGRRVKSHAKFTGTVEAEELQHWVDEFADLTEFEWDAEPIEMPKSKSKAARNRPAVRKAVPTTHPEQKPVPPQTKNRKSRRKQTNEELVDREEQHAKERPVPPGEVADWLRVFGSADGAESAPADPENKSK